MCFSVWVSVPPYVCLWLSVPAVKACNYWCMYVISFCILQCVWFALGYACVGFIYWVCLDQPLCSVVQVFLLWLLSRFGSQQRTRSPSWTHWRWSWLSSLVSHRCSSAFVSACLTMCELGLNLCPCFMPIDWLIELFSGIIALFYECAWIKRLDMYRSVFKTSHLNKDNVMMASHYLDGPLVCTKKLSTFVYRKHRRRKKNWKLKQCGVDICQTDCWLFSVKCKPEQDETWSPMMGTIS